MASPKIILLCFDGASFNYLSRPKSRGLLPNLSALVNRGASGTLESVVPCQTPASWPSLATGCFPSKHGVFGWWKTEPDFSGVRPVTGADVRLATMWSLLSRNQIKIGVVNAPIFFPADNSCSFFVSGFGTPFASKGLVRAGVHPDDLYMQIRQQWPNYKVILGPDAEAPGSIDSHLDDWISMERDRAQLAFELAKGKEPDVLVVGFHIAAYFHHILEREDERFDRLYGAIDQCLGILMDLGSKNTTTIVVSDHGVQRIHTNFFINNWLKSNGYLAYRNGIHQNDQSFGSIDWARTTAYTLSNYGHIRLNLRGREPFGIVEPGNLYAVASELRDRLAEVRHPDSDRIIFKEVSLAAECFHPPIHPDTPDIIPMIADYGNYCNSVSDYCEGFEGAFEAASDTIKRMSLAGFGAAYQRISDHDQNGIFIASGPGVKPQTDVVGLRLIDVAPTVLALMGSEVPKHMDGVVLSQVWPDLSSAQVSHVPVPDSFPAATAGHEDVGRSVAQDLKSIGYKF